MLLIILSEWRANRIEPENPYRNGTLQAIPEFLHVYTQAENEQQNDLDWNMFSEGELERTFISYES